MSDLILNFRWEHIETLGKVPNDITFTVQRLKQSWIVNWMTKRLWLRIKLFKWSILISIVSASNIDFSYLLKISLNDFPGFKICGQYNFRSLNSDEDSFTTKVLFRKKFDKNHVWWSLLNCLDYITELSSKCIKLVFYTNLSQTI